MITTTTTLDVELPPPDIADEPVPAWAVVDFETNYGDDCTIQHGAYNYVHNPNYHAYMVSIVCRSLGLRYVGSVEDAPWDKIDGLIWVAHNASFDSLVYNRCVEVGQIKPHAGRHPRPSEWQCTADMSAFLQAPRNLAGAAPALINRRVDKGMRTWMKNKTWADAVAAGKDKELLQYALDDSLLADEIWATHQAKWPQWERDMAAVTRKQGQRGLHVDVPALDKGIDDLLRVRHDAMKKIPWANTLQAHGKNRGKEVPILSAPAFRTQCAKCGLTVPDSLAKDDEDFEKWLELHAKDHEWVSAVGVYRQSNAHLSRLLAIKRRLRPDGTIDYGMKYYGADTTGRSSGDSGLNMQNLPRKAKFGVNIREMFIAGPDHTFVIADLSQIEPRVLAYFAKDEPFLELCRKGKSPYEAHAMATMGWRPTTQKLKDEDADLYALCKVRVLQLGYGSGWAKFIGSAYVYGAQKYLQTPVNPAQVAAFEDYMNKFSDDDTRAWYSAATSVEQTEAVNAWIQVNQFRADNPRIKKLWNSIEEAMSSTDSLGGDVELKLPSGRAMRYFDVRKGKDGLTCTTELRGDRKHFYGAKFVENMCQGLARDIFFDRMLELERLGFLTVLQVHDEVVIRCLKIDAANVANVVRQVMRTPPSFMPANFPLDSEVVITDRYKK